MDTRSKILSAAEARQLPGPLTVAAGYFDVPRAALVRELDRARRPGAVLLAVVLPLENGLLGARQRAEMAAGLRVVDYVLIADEGDPDALIESLKPASVARLEAAEQRRALQLREHVRNRQTTP